MNARTFAVAGRAHGCTSWIGIGGGDGALRLVPAYFFCAFELQNEGSLATHSGAGMLKSGRTAKILASGPAADSFTSASVRVFAAVKTNRRPS